MSETNSFVRNWIAVREMQGQIRGDALRIVIDALKDENVTQVVMTYSGGGDSGEYHYPIYTMQKGDELVCLESREGYGGSSYRLESTGTLLLETKVAMPRAHYGDWDAETNTQKAPRIEKTERMLVEAVYLVMEDAVESRHEGWYNNEGGEGTVTLNVGKGRIEVSHGDYVTETVWNEYTVEAGNA